MPPPIKRNLSFEIDALPRSPLLRKAGLRKNSAEAEQTYGPAIRKLRESLAKKFDLRLMPDGIWLEAALDEKLLPILDHVAQLATSRKANFTFGSYTESLADSQACEWYRIEPHRRF